MFPPALRAHLALLIAYVAAVSAAPPTNVPSKSSFVIASPPGSRPTFSGGSVNYDSAQVANPDDPPVLAPGWSINVTHNRPATYSFTQSGAGDDSIERTNQLTHVGADDTTKDLHATVESVAKVKHSRNLVVSRRVHDKRVGPDSRPKFENCETHEKALIKRAAKDAKKLLAEAVTVSERVMGRAFSDGEDNYELWLGEYSQSRAHKIWSTLRKIRKKLSFSEFTYDCNCIEGFPAEIIPDQPRIRICRPFWNLLPAQKVAQLIRLAGQRVRTVRTFSLGPAGTRSLAASTPNIITKNLDNYVAFIWKTPDPLATPPPDDPPPYDPAPYDPPPPYSG